MTFLVIESHKSFRKGLAYGFGAALLGTALAALLALG